MPPSRATEKQIGLLLRRIRNSPLRDMLPSRVVYKNGSSADYRYYDAGVWLKENLTINEAHELIQRFEKDSFMETIEHLVAIGFPIVHHSNPTGYGNPKSATKKS